MLHIPLALLATCLYCLSLVGSCFKEGDFPLNCVYINCFQKRVCVGNEELSKLTVYQQNQAVVVFRNR